MCNDNIAMMGYRYFSFFRSEMSFGCRAFNKVIFHSLHFYVQVAGGFNSSTAISIMSGSRIAAIFAVAQAKVGHANPQR